jgi:hypothetical protein
MKAWRVAVIALSFLLLSGCLVTFKEPLPTNEAAPKALLGKWSSKDAWGEPLNLPSPAPATTYKAVSYPTAKPGQREEYLFTVSRHGNRWYLSARARQVRWALLPGRFRDRRKARTGGLQPRPRADHSSDGQQALHGRPWTPSKALACWWTAPGPGLPTDDPANADVFVEAVRYRRVGK